MIRKTILILSLLVVKNKLIQRPCRPATKRRGREIKLNYITLNLTRQIIITIQEKKKNIIVLQMERHYCTLLSIHVRFLRNKITGAFERRKQEEWGWCVSVSCPGSPVPRQNLTSAFSLRPKSFVFFHLIWIMLVGEYKL